MKVRALILSGIVAAVPIFLAHASEIQPLTEFTAGGAIKASEMNANFAAVRSAVNDSQTQIDAIKLDNQILLTDVAALKSGIGCVGNNPSDVMVQVGSVCVDKFKASLWDTNTATASTLTTVPGTCAADGTGCSGVVAQSRETPGSVLSGGLSFAQAIQACGNAGKRLLNPGEWLLAFGSGLLADISKVDTLEFVDHISRLPDPAGAGTPPASTPIQGTYIGPRSTPANGKIQIFSNVAYDSVRAEPFIGFRCAR